MTTVFDSYKLCTERDEFIENECMWVVTLSDGTKIWQDDNRPGLKTSSAWIRLGAYLKDHPEDKIVDMCLRFGTHVVPLTPNKECYFYSHGMLQGLAVSAATMFHIVGWENTETNDLECTWYKAPELIVSEVKHRPFDSCVVGQLIGKIPA